MVERLAVFSWAALWLAVSAQASLPLGAVIGPVAFAAAGVSASVAVLMALLERRVLLLSSVLLTSILFVVLRGALSLARGDTNEVLLAVIATLLLVAAGFAHPDRAPRIMFRTTVVLVLVLVVPVLLGFGFISPSRSLLPGVDGRYFGGWSHPNALGFFAGSLIFVALACRPDRRRYSLIVAAGAALVVVLTGTLTSVAGCMAGIAMAALYRRAQPVVLWLAGVLTLAACGMVLALLYGPGPAILQGLATQVDATGRTHIWLRLFVHIREASEYSLWWGAGDHLLESTAEAVYGVYSAHSTLLQLLLGSGAVAALLFLFCYFSAVAAAARGRVPVSDRAWLVAGVTLGAVTALASTQPGTAAGLALVVFPVLCRSTGVESDDRPAVRPETAHR